ncbi:MAG TPA: aconitase/3-isopropylmalate dehydratase large subunit family protein [Gemmatimonadaceae bacterium]|nr:aconitase/3-isopropylmalate dehydratase large subunit family protein [Gemmatimonadaceae bacterium]
MTAKTMAEQVLSARSGTDARAGDVVVCDVDVVLGTDGSGPMAIDYFGAMGGTRLARPGTVFFSLDHYAPPTTDATRAFHARIRAFAAAHGATVFGVGEGISHQLAAERGIVRPGTLLAGADSHAVTCGALNAFAIGVGSSDLAAAMLTGQAWLRVPQTIRVRLDGALGAGASAKDAALTLVAMLGADGADYHAIEFAGSGVATLGMDDRFVFSNLMVEAGAKAALFPFDACTESYLFAAGVSASAYAPVASHAGAAFAGDRVLDLSAIGPCVARPHAPDDVVVLADAAGTPVQMVFVGTCTGGRVADFHAMRRAFDAAGGRVAPGVQLVLTPASAPVLEALMHDGTLTHLIAAGADVTTVGCGACCGTSGVIPSDGATVLSTANRNFKGRMGAATARIFLASPAVCGAAAATGRIPSSLTDREAP